MLGERQGRSPFPRMATERHSRQQRRVVYRVRRHFLLLLCRANVPVPKRVKGEGVYSWPLS